GSASGSDLSIFLNFITVFKHFAVFRPREHHTAVPCGQTELRKPLHPSRKRRKVLRTRKVGLENSLCSFAENKTLPPNTL
ncbi:hypothetical protein, partial [Acinetobacter baumannii]|uniref:hypothetical protein n=1 Tax=Acinetobacter baumannii TaxID=470 RepID=UPI00331D378D